MPVTYVPARNTILLASRAGVRGSRRLRSTCSSERMFSITAGIPIAGRSSSRRSRTSRTWRRKPNRRSRKVPGSLAAIEDDEMEIIREGQSSVDYSQTLLLRPRFVTGRLRSVRFVLVEKGKASPKTSAGPDGIQVMSEERKTAAIARCLYSSPPTPALLFTLRRPFLPNLPLLKPPLPLRLSP